MAKKPLLIAASIILVSLGQWVHADSHQQQSSSSSTSLTERGDEEASYVIWPKGNGRVHRKAKVDPTAEISKDSKVGPYTIVGAQTQVRASILMGDSEAHPARIGKKAFIESSTLQGAFTVGDGARITITMMQGPIEVAPQVKLSSCTLSAMKSVKISSDMANEMAMLPRM